MKAVCLLQLQVCVFCALWCLLTSARDEIQESGVQSGMQEKVSLKQGFILFGVTETEASVSHKEPVELVSHFFPS